MKKKSDNGTTENDDSHDFAADQLDQNTEEHILQQENNEIKNTEKRKVWTKSRMGFQMLRMSQTNLFVGTLRPSKSAHNLTKIGLKEEEEDEEGQYENNEAIEDGVSSLQYSETGEKKKTKKVNKTATVPRTSVMHNKLSLYTCGTYAIIGFLYTCMDEVILCFCFFEGCKVFGSILCVICCVFEL